MRFKVIFGVLCVAVNGLSATNYCDPNVCESYDLQGNTIYEEHIACGHPHAFPKHCVNGNLLEMPDWRKSSILVLHNHLRTQLALGYVPGFPSASRMSTIEWDDELAQLAELNVMQCKMKHDMCHNTDQFRNSGQNLGLTLTNVPIDYDAVVSSHIQTWFKEHRFANKSDIEFFRPPNPRLPKISHFTTMVNEKATRIGCAVATFNLTYMGKVWNAMLVACNYSFTNILSDPTYTQGPPCSRCYTGCSTEFPGLCTTHEYYKNVPED